MAGVFPESPQTERYVPENPASSAGSKMASVIATEEYEELSRRWTDHPIDIQSE
ncbi:hypothetical protein BofuT4_uP075660.1 [Botrytis cinerea T4]|uniref:Uncharacterized protein n=1 Tax=Botryotinia fuckeliana (strain T4) TaxID=999810 RepID=G2XNM7_BOTF4|nr:hypothetical protein BofuT4_uP075660.1 [Botrytis cinerea T4]